jgi:hypothetical protein
MGHDERKLCELEYHSGFSSPVGKHLVFLFFLYPRRGFGVLNRAAGLRSLCQERMQEPNPGSDMGGCQIEFVYPFSVSTLSFLSLGCGLHLEPAGIMSKFDIDNASVILIPRRMT